MLKNGLLDHSVDYGRRKYGKKLIQAMPRLDIFHAIVIAMAERMNAQKQVQVY